VAAARFAAAQGARVTVNDAAAPDTLADAPGELSAMGAAVVTGHHPPDLFTTADLVVLSPGVPHEIAPVRAAADAGVPVMGEFALACRYITEPLVAVTGTNGKTTVTSLLGDILERSGKTVFVGGNIGNPLIGHIAEGRPVDVVVAEVSSFQLDTAPGFRPDVSVLLNITDDHLDRYPDRNAYAASKAAIFASQRSSDIAVINAGDPAVRAAAANIAADRWVYGPDAGSSAGSVAAAIGEDDIRIYRHGERDMALNLSAAPLQGLHNRENMAAAALAGLAAGATLAGAQEAINAFSGLPHRMEPVGEHKGVRFINDSRATNVDAVKRALETFAGKSVVLIMGGRDKGSDFTGLEAGVRQLVKQLVTVGEAAGTIYEALSHAAPATRAASLAEGVRVAVASASPGDVVLLSPGCASFDEFQSYAQRGETFRHLVRNLP
jgi:UDP-N-acetylmuramoylalanine--D-glutamate ligase